MSGVSVRMDDGEVGVRGDELGGYAVLGEGVGEAGEVCQLDLVAVAGGPRGRGGLVRPATRPVLGVGHWPSLVLRTRAMIAAAWAGWVQGAMGSAHGHR
jgi:hypothetical protein